MKPINITLYEYAGKKWFFSIKNECEECTITAGLLKDIEKEVKGKVKLTIKPWLDNIFTVLFKGGWHAPIVTVNGKIISQGVVPSKDKILKAIHAI